MHTIQFDANNRKTIYTLSKSPSLILELIHFQTQDENWTTRLLNSNLKVTLTCLDISNEPISTSSQPISHLVSAYHKNPYLVYNHKQIIFDDSLSDPYRISSYRVEIELCGMQLNSNESYTIRFHLLEHSNYQVFCAGNPIAAVYITDFHPSKPNNRIVAFTPVNTIQIAENRTHFEFGDHQNLIAEKGVSDEVIIRDLFTREYLACSQNYTVMKL